MSSGAMSSAEPLFIRAASTESHGSRATKHQAPSKLDVDVDVDSVDSGECRDSWL